VESNQECAILRAVAAAALEVECSILRAVAELKVESNIECAILRAVAVLEVEKYDVPQAAAAAALEMETN
jgi:hypothetical protein